MTSPNALSDQLGKAFALHQAGRLAEAEPLYRAILKTAPAHFDTLHMLGVLCLQIRQPGEALDLIGRALKAKPTSAAALNNHGNALRELGRHDEALASYSRAVAADPNYLDALQNRGASLQLLDRVEEALHDYDQILRLNPGYAVALKNRGKALEQLNRYEDALTSYQQALEIEKKSPDILAGKASALRGLKRFDEALTVCDQALALDCDNLHALNVRGATLRDMHRYTEAMSCFDRAIALKSDHLEALVNRGTTLHEMSRPDDAIAAYDKALTLYPENAGAHWNRALALLTAQRFNEGWPEFEWRFKYRNIVTRAAAFPQPQWDGRALSDRSLLIWGEQGVGDEVLYAGMVDDLIARGISIVWDADARLHPLIARSYPAIKTVARTTPPDAATRDAAIGAQISAASLCRYLRPDVASFPKSTRAYLKADGKKTATYRAQLMKDGAKRVIGVSWVSNNPDFGTHKSSRLADWAPLWHSAGPGTKFVDLQYGDTAAERAAAPFPLAHIDGLDLFHDLDGLAALIAACDLVITVSNTTAHLAGALGIPLWIMLSQGSGKLWYWGADQTTSPWYPSAAIFRQDTSGAWTGVLSQMAARLVESA